jgi:hypothetical protein
MAKRKQGNNKRQPRMTAAGINTRCISIMPDGSAEYFAPKKVSKSTRVDQKDDGTYYIVSIERALR